MILEPLHPVQAQRLRAMSPAEKWDVAKGLLRTARETRRAGLALRHPDWSPQQDRAGTRPRTRPCPNLISLKSSPLPFTGAGSDTSWPVRWGP